MLAPFGYAKVRTQDLPPEDERRHYIGYTIVPVEPAASMARKAAADVLAGVSMRSIVKDWNLRGVTTTKGQPWRNITLRYLLATPVYAALVGMQAKENGHAYRQVVVGPGDWEPILDRDTYEGLAAMLGDPARKEGTKYRRRHMGSGVYDCAICGGKLYAN